MAVPCAAAPLGPMAAPAASVVSVAPGPLSIVARRAPRPFTAGASGSASSGALARRGGGDSKRASAQVLDSQRCVAGAFGVRSAASGAAVSAAAAVLGRRLVARRRQVAACRVVAVGAASEATVKDAMEGTTSGPFFQPWADWLEDHFVQSLGLQEQALPPEYAIRHGRSSDGSAVSLRGHLFVGEDRRCPARRLRYVVVDGGRGLQAFNAVLYPNPELGPLPILGVDLLSFNGHARLLFGIDWAPLLRDPAYLEAYIAEHVGDIKATRATLATEPGGKLYGEAPEFFSPNMFFARPEGAEAMQRDAGLWEVFEEYCVRYGDMLLATTAKGPTDGDVAERAMVRQDDYDAWHADRDPALAIFKKLFGGKWTEDYTRDYLFPGAARVAARGNASAGPPPITP